MYHSLTLVIPAEAGIQGAFGTVAKVEHPLRLWVPACVGTTDGTPGGWCDCLQSDIHGAIVLAAKMGDVCRNVFRWLSLLLAKA